MHAPGTPASSPKPVGFCVDGQGDEDSPSQAPAADDGLSLHGAAEAEEEAAAQGLTRLADSRQAHLRTAPPLSAGKGKTSGLLMVLALSSTIDIIIGLCWGCSVP